MLSAPHVQLFELRRAGSGGEHLPVAFEVAPKFQRIVIRFKDTRGYFASSKTLYYSDISSLEFDSRDQTWFVLMPWITRNTQTQEEYKILVDDPVAFCQIINLLQTSGLSSTDRAAQGSPTGSLRAEAPRPVTFPAVAAYKDAEYTISLCLAERTLELRDPTSGRMLVEIRKELIQAAALTDDRRAIRLTLRTGRVFTLRPHNADNLSGLCLFACAGGVPQSRPSASPFLRGCSTERSCARGAGPLLADSCARASPLPPPPPPLVSQGASLGGASSLRRLAARDTTERSASPASRSASRTRSRGRDRHYMRPTKSSEKKSCPYVHRPPSPASSRSWSPLLRELKFSRMGQDTSARDQRRLVDSDLHKLSPALYRPLAAERAPPPAAAWPPDAPRRSQADASPFFGNASPSPAPPHVAFPPPRAPYIDAGVQVSSAPRAATPVAPPRTVVLEISTADGAICERVEIDTADLTKPGKLFRIQLKARAHVEVISSPISARAAPAAPVAPVAPVVSRAPADVASEVARAPLGATEASANSEPEPAPPPAGAPSSSTSSCPNSEGSEETSHVLFDPDKLSEAFCAPRYGTISPEFAGSPAAGAGAPPPPSLDDQQMVANVLSFFPRTSTPEPSDAASDAPSAGSAGPDAPMSREELARALSRPVSGFVPRPVLPPALEVPSARLAASIAAARERLARANSIQKLLKSDTGDAMREAFHVRVDAEAGSVLLDEIVAVRLGDIVSVADADTCPHVALVVPVSEQQRARALFVRDARWFVLLFPSARDADAWARDFEVALSHLPPA